MDHELASMSASETYVDLWLCRSGREQCAPRHACGPLVRDHFLFCYILSGRGCLESAGGGAPARRFDLEAGAGFLTCPGQTNTCSADRKDPWNYVWLEFDGLRAEKYLQSAGLNAAQPIYRPRTAPEAGSVRDEMLYIADHAGASSLHLLGHLCLFLDGLIRTSSSRQTAHTVRLQDFYTQEAVLYMERNYHRELTVEEVAGVCKLNRSYFSKLFKENMGCSPQEFLIRMRLSKAAAKMRTTRVPIGDIALSCGYPNQLHFSRAFKKRYGVSPREWRAANQVRTGL